MLGLDPANGRHAAHLRHGQIGQDDVGLQPIRQGHGLHAVGSLPDDLEVGLAGEYVAQAGSHDEVVVGYK
jgi:hypothetical protein